MNNSIHKEANWELHISYRQKGTRSEGQHGLLFHNGRTIIPAYEGQELETPLGRLKYYRHPENAVFLFAITGWNFADRNRIRPSSHMLATTAVTTSFLPTFVQAYVGTTELLN